MSTADLSNLLLAYLAFALMIISPGPNQLAVIAATVAYGRRAGRAVAFGISSGSFTWTVLTFAGLSAVLAQTAGALMVIKIAGGLYLLWFAFKSWRTAMTGPVEIKRARAGGAGANKSHYLRGYTLQMTS